jgi:very-short-patch-repair endonuclease
MKNKIIPYNPKLKELARKLRKESTIAEVLLWKEIQNKKLGAEFHRQVSMLDYIVDFYCNELMLAIEIDGISHNYDEIKTNDALRQAKIEAFGVAFLKFDDRLVRQDMPNTIREIEARVQKLNNKI